MQRRSLPAIEAAFRFRIFVQRCGCRSLALYNMRNALPRESDTASTYLLCAMRRMRQSGAAANRGGESFGSYLCDRTPAGAARGAMRALPAQFFLAKTDVARGTD